MHESHDMAMRKERENYGIMEWVKSNAPRRYGNVRTVSEGRTKKQTSTGTSVSGTDVPGRGRSFTVWRAEEERKTEGVLRLERAKFVATKERAGLCVLVNITPHASL